MSEQMQQQLLQMQQAAAAPSPAAVVPVTAQPVVAQPMAQPLVQPVAAQPLPGAVSPQPVVAQPLPGAVSPQPAVDAAAAMQQMMAGFNEVPMGGGGIYLGVGNHLLKIIECKNGRAPQGGFAFFVTEFEVLLSDNPNHRPGSRVEWMVSFKVPQYFKTYQRDVKQFLYNAFRGFDASVTEEAITDQVWAAAASVGQPLANRYVGACASDKPKKNKPGELFTKVNFQPWAGPLPGEAPVVAAV